MTLHCHLIAFSDLPLEQIPSQDITVPLCKRGPTLLELFHGTTVNQRQLWAPLPALASSRQLLPNRSSS